MSGHTPGPWWPDLQRATDARSPDPREWGHAEVTAYIPGTDESQAILRADRGEPEDIANVQLAAAAKDLLEALEDIARGPLQGPSDFSAYAQRRASAAIAKARGGEEP
jgi:hypothetical protein